MVAMKFALDDKDDDDVVVSHFRRCCTTVVSWSHSIDGGVGTKDNDDDRRVVVGRSVVGSWLLVAGCW